MTIAILIDSDKTVRSEIIKILQELSNEIEVLEFASTDEIEKNLTGEDVDETTLATREKILAATLLIVEMHENSELEKFANAHSDHKFKMSAFPTKPQLYLLSFNPEKFDRDFAYSCGVVNILHKPIDRLIAKESLNAILFQDELLKPVELVPQKPIAFAAMVKNISPISICELGFVTLNDSAIPINSVSKYFKDIFSHGKKQSVWAQCLLSLEIPDQPGTFINKFQFLGIERAQLMNIRHYVSTHKNQRVANSVWNLESHGVEKFVKIALIGRGDLIQRNLKHELESNFHNIEVDYLEFNDEQINSQFTGRYDCIISLSDDVEYETLRAHFVHDSVFLLITSQQCSEERLELLIHQYRNIFTYPFDRPYFFKILKILVNNLKFNEVPELYNLTYVENLKAVNLVKIKEICEPYVVFDYPRELPKGSFREFALIGEDEHDIFEIPAYCRYTEKLKTVKNLETHADGRKDQLRREATHLHQFLFWGMNDHFLKRLRLWLLHNHVLKNKS